MAALKEILMFFLSVENQLMFGALLFCRRLRPRFSVPASALTEIGYFVLVNVISEFIVLLTGRLMFGWFDLSYLLWALMCYAAFLLSFDVRPSDALFVTTVSVAMQHLNYQSIMIASTVFSMDPETLRFRLIYLGASALVYVCFYFFFIRRMDIAERLNMDGKNLLLFALIAVLASIVLNQYAISSAPNGRGSLVYHIAMAFGTLCLLMLMLRAFCETKAEYDKKVVETI